MKGRREAVVKLNVIKLDIDYQLQTLFDAMKSNDDQAKQQAKAKLYTLRNQLNNHKLGV
jgi:hypothetical protein